MIDIKVCGAKSTDTRLYRSKTASQNTALRWAIAADQFMTRFRRKSSHQLIEIKSIGSLLFDDLLHIDAGFLAKTNQIVNGCGE